MGFNSEILSWGLCSLRKVVTINNMSEPDTPKYIIQSTPHVFTDGTSVVGREPTTVGFADERPTQEHFKSLGIGEYELRRGDGSLTKSYLVTRNRNNNLTITGYAPDGLAGISTLNLNRLLKYYEKIVKYWPVKNADVRKIQSELTLRSTIIAQATEPFVFKAAA